MGLNGTSTRLCVVRHGETPWNAERRLQGHLDVPLNEHGEKQARATASLLETVHFDAIYTSDLVRAQATARILAQKRTSPQSEPGLRERHYGVFQGLTYDEAKQQHPLVYARFEARDPTFAFPGGGESLMTFQDRILATLNTIIARHRGQTILIVTHGGVLDIVHRLASNKPLDAPRDFLIPNAAINWLACTPQGWQIEAWAVCPERSSALDELPTT